MARQRHPEGEHGALEPRLVHVAIDQLLHRGQHVDAADGVEDRAGIAAQQFRQCRDEPGPRFRISGEPPHRDQRHRPHGLPGRSGHDVGNQRRRRRQPRMQHPFFT